MARSTASTVSSTPSRKGDCPSWCVTVHPQSEDPGKRIHFSAATTISPDLADSTGYLTTKALTSEDVTWWRGHIVSVSGYVHQADERHIFGVHPQARDAAELADIIDLLAAATPEEHRELAAGIRRCAALIEKASSGSA